MTQVYLDYNATAPVRPAAAQAALEAMQAVGNPSSVHSAGRAAHARIEQARADVATLVGSHAPSVTFVSGGAEANALAIDSAIATGARRLIVSAIEHATVLETAKAAALTVEIMPVDAQGVADLGWLAERLSRWDAADGAPFVALMLANNETGVIQPIAQAAALVREAGGWLHADAVQAAGKIAIDFRELGADTLSLSAHKLGGPQGVGALVAGARSTISRRLHGGGQERGRRAGTQNVPGIAGFGAAASEALQDLQAIADRSTWRDTAERALLEAGAVVFGERVDRLANTLCFAAPGYDANLQVMSLDLAGVMVSAGAACSSGKVTPSHVLAAMGAGDLAGCAIRASGGWATCEQDWSRLAEAWIEANDRRTARRRASAA
ncbi:cysteine desulfurase family protein [Phenylobacterium sp.]|uniref:cysteine desulfurase family protein n=1 Tax=Phenylobacterium sp. TaxID=1871053 RepID=UPI002733AE34|nr:cysteine desulfurase family protein [Phenylobacterium sp.]MDP3659942.1 cysteine desulfurase family protein [Phenylobacterium sp.]